MPLLLYSFGYRFSWNAREWLRAGGLSVSSIPSTGTKIYINGELTKETSFFSRKLDLQGLTPGMYEIVVKKDGYYQWSKHLPVYPEQVTDALALLVEELPKEGKILLQGPYEKISFLDSSEETVRLNTAKNKPTYFSLTQSTTTIIQKEPATTTPELPNSIKELLAEKKPDGYDYDASQERIIWWNGKRIWVKWLRGEAYLPLYTEKTEDIVWEADQDIRSAEFYPGQDSILATYSNVVMVIELDGRDTRNAFPLYKGKEPACVVASRSKTAYILDAGNFISIPIP